MCLSPWALPEGLHVLGHNEAVIQSSSLQRHPGNMLTVESFDRTKKMFR